MIHRCRILIIIAGMVGSLNLPIASAQQPDPNSPRYKGVVALSDAWGEIARAECSEFQSNGPVESLDLDPLWR